MRELNYRQRLFLSYYCGVSQGNGADAARRAGYRKPGEAAARLVNLPTIRAHIDAKLSEVGMPQEEVLARTAEIAGFNIGELLDVNADGTWSFNIAKAKRLKKLGPVKKLKLKRETRWEGKGNGDYGKEPVVTDYIEVEAYSKLDALDKLLRYHGAYKDRLDVTTAGDKIQTILYLPDNGRDPEPSRDNPNDPPAVDPGTLPGVDG